MLTGGAFMTTSVSLFISRYGLAATTPSGVGRILRNAYRSESSIIE